MTRTHYLANYKPDAFKPQLIGYCVWAYMGHPLLGQLKETTVRVKTKYQAQKTARKLRDYFNEGKDISIPDNWIRGEVTT